VIVRNSSSKCQGLRSCRYRLRLSTGNEGLFGGDEDAAMKSSKKLAAQIAAHRASQRVTQKVKINCLRQLRLSWRESVCAKAIYLGWCLASCGMLRRLFSAMPENWPLAVELVAETAHSQRLTSIYTLALSLKSKRHAAARWAFPR
jgi:hypothetical protein